MVTEMSQSTPPPLFDTFTIKTVLLEAKNRLAEVEISDSPDLDAELLLAHCLDKNRTYLHTWPENSITQEQNDCFQSLIEKRITDYPVAYLLGEKAFWTFDLIVTPDVLIPRPETELLVETALEKVELIENPRILDLGTGSGAIALALAAERPDASVVASDSSTFALEIAKKNTLKYKLTHQITFVESDWFSAIEDEKFDLIVSNPPYINPKDPHLLQTIRHEPISALASEHSGMKDIETIIENSPHFLKPESWLILEHGYNQSANTLTLFSESCFINEYTLNDLNNIQRLSLGQKA